MRNGEAFQEKFRTILKEMLEDRDIGPKEFSDRAWPGMGAPKQKGQRILREGQNINLSDLWGISMALSYDPEDLIAKVRKAMIEDRKNISQKNIPKSA